MKTIEFTKKYEEPTDPVTCWFCHQPIFKLPCCQNKQCQAAMVIYVFHGNHIDEVIHYKLHKVQFKTYLNSHNFIVNYLPILKKMEVLEMIRIPDPEATSININYRFKEALNISYESLILTPDNIQTKLPTLLTFS